MKALTVVPLPEGTAALSDMPEPESDGAVLAGTLVVGVCGTDVEMLSSRSPFERMATGRVAIERWWEALQRQPYDVNVVVEVDPT